MLSTLGFAGSVTSKHFNIFPPKLDVQKGDVLGFFQDIHNLEDFEQDDVSILGEDYDSSAGEGSFEQDEESLMSSTSFNSGDSSDSSASIGSNASGDSGDIDPESPVDGEFAQAYRKKKGRGGKKKGRGGKKGKRGRSPKGRHLSQERIQFDEAARVKIMSHKPNMTQARCEQITQKLWEKYVATQ
jgi:hypothetical protein